MGIKMPGDECWSEDDFFVTRSQGGIFVPSLFWQNESSENDTGKTIRLGDVVYQGLGGMCQFPDNDRVMVSMTSDRERFEYHVCLYAIYSIKAKPVCREEMLL